MQELYTAYKNLLFKLAYQLTGSVSDAEDVVQDVFLKAADVPPDKLLAEPKAYLCKMVANRCKDLHKSARRQRERYYGEWLPEPFADTYGDEMDAVIHNDLLSYAMLVLLERLTPTERVVFVLREALGFDYQELARLTEKSEANCRKLYSRASAKMGLDAEEIVAAEPANLAWVERFLKALKQGNMDQILSMLDQDVVSISDGGGKAAAVVEPIERKEAVAQFLLGPLRQAATVNGEVRIEIEVLNGQPCLVLRSNEGIHTVGMLHVEHDRIRNLYFVRNPDKLTHADG
ncbi:RNA polymerase sigma factor SigJ [Paenibacillus silvisoli]|uniref:RNA polymerase sigma factor SigJ n=1 Tax=Paenibacillus silvisoli TaxID=3110539 RepID=UPI0028058B4C|nr:RNA polymerase sigma factor SigJ [Paenibacillus silvisoli]